MYVSTSLFLVALYKWLHPGVMEEGGGLRFNYRMTAFAFQASCSPGKAGTRIGSLLSRSCPWGSGPQQTVSPPSPPSSAICLRSPEMVGDLCLLRERSPPPPHPYLATFLLSKERISQSELFCFHPPTEAFVIGNSSNRRDRKAPEPGLLGLQEKPSVFPSTPWSSMLAASSLLGRCLGQTRGQKGILVCRAHCSGFRTV